MSEPMTPHERAKLIVHGWYCDEPEIPRVAAVEINDITTAIQAQSNEDELRHREQQAALRTLLAAALKAKDMVEAQAAELRRALDRLTDAVNADQSQLDKCSNFGLFGSASIAALDLPPVNALERVRRDAKIEALEKLPCDNTGTHAPICLDRNADEAAIFGTCPRCRALAELRKGGE
jgi:hypothetical protein